MTVVREKGIAEIHDHYLQTTSFELRDAIIVRDVERRRGVNGLESRDIARRASWRRPWGSFCIRVYRARRVRSPWFWVGLGVFGSGAIGLLLTAASVLVANTGVVTPSGGLTARGSLLLSTSTLVLGTGLSLCFRFSGGYERDDLINEYSTSLPLADWEKTGESMEEGEWQDAVTS